MAAKMAAKLANERISGSDSRKTDNRYLHAREGGFV